MNRIYHRILAVWLVICLVLAQIVPMGAWASTPVGAEPFNTNDDGLTFDRHTESDGVSYADDAYRFDKKLTAVPHTYQAWVKVPGAVTGTVGNILGNVRSSGPSIRFGIEANNAPSLVWIDEDKTSHNVTFASATSNPVFPYDTWTQITIVHDEAVGALRLYVNGALYATNTDGYAAIQQASAMRMTMHLGGDNQFWNTRSFLGALGDVAIYTDALSEQEILDSYQKGVDPSAGNLMAFYKLSAAVKYTNIADSSKHGYDLTYSKLWLTEEEMNEIRKDNGMLDENGEYTYDYSFAVVGDTQYVTRYYPENLSKIYQWIVDNKDAKNMQYVIGVGDITDQDTAEQWQTAKDAISLLNGKIGYSLVRGNHDVLNGGDLFDSHFASDGNYTKQFRDYGGTYPEGSVKNTYRTLRVGGTDWLFLNFDWGPDDGAMDWAIDVVEKHPDHKIVISTHGYLTGDGSTLDASDGDSVDPATRNNGDQIWTKLASQYENVELVLCGHISMNDILVTQNKGIHGNTVTQMLIDPQRNDYYKSGTTIYNTGGAGIVTMLYFNQDSSNVFVEHYSTIRGMYHKTCNQLTVDLDAPCEEVTEYWDGFTEIQPDGSGTAQDPYLISNGANLYWISQQIKNAESLAFDGYCLQVNDIDLGGFELPSLGCYYKGSNKTYKLFSGVYDGNGYTIKNGTIISAAETSSTSKTAYYASGLFGMISGATIRNLTLDQITSYSARLVVGVLVGAANPSLAGTAENSSTLNLIENCVVTSTCVAKSTTNGTATNLKKGENTDYTPRVGGIAGALAYTTVRNCVSEATIYTPGNHARAGGIAGSLYNDCVIDGCINRGDVVLDFNTTTSYNHVSQISYFQGGIVGSISGAAVVGDAANNAKDGSANNYKQGNISITNCENHGSFRLEGTVSAGKSIVWGGIVGYSAELLPNTDVIMHNLVNTGTVTIEKAQTIPTYTAGIVGYGTHSASATASTNVSLMLAAYDNRTALADVNVAAVNQGALPVIDTTHSFASAWEEATEGKHIAQCSCGCGETIRLAHRWNSGTVIQQPTHASQGTMEYTCVDCNGSIIESIEVSTVHSFGQWSSDGADTHSSVCQCGVVRTYAHAWENSACVYCGEIQNIETPDEEVVYWDGVTVTQPEGTGTKEDPYLITSAANLYWISQQIANAPSGNVVFEGHCLQVNDIDLSGYTLPSIGSYYKGSKTTSRVFGGVYDGNGYTIKNGTIISVAETSTNSKTTYYSSGLFGIITGATIRNVTMDNITSYSVRGVVGVLVGSATPSLTPEENGPALNLIENCVITSTCKAISKVSGDATYMSKGGENSDFLPRVGGIAGALSYTMVRNCVNEATIYSPGNHANAGGIVGALFDDCVIESCVNRGDIVLEYDTQNSYKRYDTISHVQGGIVGSISGTSKICNTSNRATDGSVTNYKNGDIRITNCENHGDFLLEGTVTVGNTIVWGGIVGRSASLLADTQVLLHNVVNTGTAVVENAQTLPTYIASIVGYGTHSATATADTNSSLVLATYENRTELPDENQVTVNQGALPAIYKMNAVAEVDGMPYESLEEAFKTKAVVKLLQSQETTMSLEATVDLNGFQLTLDGSGVLTGIDTSNDDYEGYGKLKVIGDITVQQVAESGDKQYIAVQETDGTWGFHRVEVMLSAVSLRSSAAGLYYKATYQCDETLANRVDSIGVALGVNAIPDDLNGYEYMTAYSAEELKDKYKDHKIENVTSGSVFGILKEGNTPAVNVRNLQTDIYAKAYLAINVDGQKLYVTSQESGWNLLEVLEAVDEMFDCLQPDQKDTLVANVALWQKWLGDAMNLAEKLAKVTAYNVA